mmetsp:Transcript_9744/g.23325  ORF Transcript_9744/g.23325 Transcript_9744/m.23325 type:complete len:110 (+) Transcript_9744:1610-1939(+)
MFHASEVRDVNWCTTKIHLVGGLCATELFVIPELVQQAAFRHLSRQPQLQAPAATVDESSKSEAPEAADVPISNSVLLDCDGQRRESSFVTLGNIRWLQGKPAREDARG